MTRYRLEAQRAFAGPHLFPQVFATVDEACAYAETSLEVTGPHAAWKMRGYRVREVASGKTVTNVNWYDPDDPDDVDPFAPALPAAGGKPGTETDMALPAAPSLPGPISPPPVPSTAPGGDVGAGPTATGAGPTLCECGAPLGPGETRCSGCRRFDRFMDAPR